MSLYFKERIEEQKEDPENDVIVFTYPWIIQFPPATEDENDIEFKGAYLKCYNFATIGWNLYLLHNSIYITIFNFDDGLVPIGNGTCFISYTLYYDNDMEFHSSPRIPTVSSSGAFICNQNGFLTKFVDTFKEGKCKKIVVFIEMHLPAKYFRRPFDHPSHYLQSKSCEKFPDDMNNDYRFEFLKEGDYSIKCRDGSVPALRMVLNVSSKFMKKHLKESKDVELVVQHSVDVVKPVILFMHSLCFEMPKYFDLHYADRLLKAFNFFQPDRISNIHGTIQLSLCQKFVGENVDFDSILRWFSFALRHRMESLTLMIIVVIVHKFYFKWYQIFPENARNAENPYFRDIFGPRDDAAQIFEVIDSIFFDSLFTNVILN